SAAKGSRRGLVGPLAPLSLLELPPTAPVLARFFSAPFSRSLSLLLMYINPRWALPPFFVHVSSDGCFFKEWLPSGPGDSGSGSRSMLGLPMLSAPDVR